jgi:hypothetical protein
LQCPILGTGSREEAKLVSFPWTACAEKLSSNKINWSIAIRGVYAIGGSRLNEAFGEDPRVHEEASRARHLKAGLPPFLIIYDDNDFTGLDELAEWMGKGLKDAKDLVTVMKIDNRTKSTSIDLRNLFTFFLPRQSASGTCGWRSNVALQ